MQVLRTEQILWANEKTSDHVSVFGQNFLPSPAALEKQSAPEDTCCEMHFSTTFPKRSGGLRLPLLLYSTPLPHEFSRGIETREGQHTQGCLLSVPSTAHPRRGALVPNTPEESHGGPRKQAGTTPKASNTTPKVSQSLTSTTCETHHLKKN